LIKKPSKVLFFLSHERLELVGDVVLILLVEDVNPVWHLLLNSQERSEQFSLIRVVSTV